MSRRAPSQPPVIPGFEHIKLLGSGGFADVFLYQQQHPRRQVAVKVLLSQRADTAANFTEEANLMAQLAAHPSIVSVHEAGVAQDGRPYLVMEYCSRPNLQARHRRERFSEAETLRVGIQIASAIEAAHRIGILHRDIKPANILVTEYGRPALTDFGISTTAGSEMSGMSVPWSPPEVFRSPPGGDASSDVYSLAATLYTLLTNRTPFEVPGGSNSDIDVISRIQTAPLPRTGRPEVSADLEAVLTRAMAKDPAARFRSALEFARALQRVQINQGMQETPIDVAEEDLDLTPEDEDEPRTRFRGVTSIAAQQNPAPTVPLDTATTLRSVSQPTAPTAPMNATVDEQTLLRAESVPATRSTLPTAQVFDRPAGSEPARGSAAITSNAPEAPPLDDTVHRVASVTTLDGPLESEPQRARRPVIGLIIGAVAVLGAVAVSAALILTPETPKDPAEELSTTAPVDAIGAPSAPVVTSLGGIVTGADAAFTWVNPDPQPGDLYLWREVTPGEVHEYAEVESESVTVAADATGRTCIEVVLRRANGASAAEGAQACTP